MKAKKIVYNIIFGFGGKIIIMIISFIVPRLMIFGYGSEVNGLFYTLNNIYTYMAIIEAGIGTSAVQLLYKPVIDNDRESISNILYTTKKYFYKCGWIYLGGVIILSIIFPFTLNTSINKWSVAIVALLQGLASLFNYFIVSGLTVLLTAEGKQYVTNNIVLVMGLLTNATKIILVNLRVNIVVLQAAYFAISLLGTFIYYFYFKKNYPWINRKSGDDRLKLPQRKSFLLHYFASIVFNNTDTILITFFCGLKSASIYAVYNMVFTNLISLINSGFNGLKYVLGQKYNQDKREYAVLHDVYKSYYCAIVFAVISVAYVLMIPFVTLYTDGITDAVYINKYLPILFCLVNLLSSCRMTEVNLVELSFHAKQTLSRAMIETVLNLVLSLALVKTLGIYGCLIGTIIALLYRTNDFLIYANRKILNRSPQQAYLTVVTNFLMFFTIVVINRYVELNIKNYGSLFLYGGILFIIFIIVYWVLNTFTNFWGFLYLRQKVLFLLKKEETAK